MAYEEGVRFADHSVRAHWLELTRRQQATVEHMAGGHALTDIRFGHDGYVSVDFKSSYFDDQPTDTISVDYDGDLA